MGTDQNGRRVYFLFPKAPFGSMGQRSLVATARLVPVPDQLPDDFAAALATAGLASWIALSRRAKLVKGETVLVNGATGAAGAMALQIARYFGAKKVIAVGRNTSRLDELNADVKIALNGDASQALRAEFDQGVDVVLDFIWGEPASLILKAAATDRGSPAGEPRLRYVALGNLAGDEIALRADMLRSSGLELIGSATGSVSFQDFISSANELLTIAPAAGFTPAFTSVPLSQVREIWNGDPNIRYVLQPNRH